MKSLNQFSSRKEWENHLWEEFIKILSKISSENQTLKFLNILLTKREKENLIKKLVVIALIRKGKNYKEISELLWLSPNTVSAVKKGLKNSLYESYQEISKNRNSIRSKREQKSKKSERITMDDLFIALEDFAEWFDKIMLSIDGKGRWKF